MDTGFRQEACRQALAAGLAGWRSPWRTRTSSSPTSTPDHAGLARVSGPTSRIFVSATDRAGLPGPACTGRWEDFDDLFLANGFPLPQLKELEQSNPAGACPLPLR